MYVDSISQNCICCADTGASCVLRVVYLLKLSSLTLRAWWSTTFLFVFCFVGEKSDPAALSAHLRADADAVWGTCDSQNAFFAVSLSPSYDVIPRYSYLYLWSRDPRLTRRVLPFVNETTGDAATCTGVTLEHTP